MTRLSAWGLLLGLLIVMLALSGCGGGSATSPGGGVHPSTVPVAFETDLIAGAGQGWPATGTDVGDVKVWDDGGTNLYVEYVLHDGYEFCDDASNDDAAGTGEVHLYVRNTPPTTVAPGQYPYNQGSPEFMGFTSNPATASFKIPLGGTVTLGSNLYIIAHAKVHSAGGYDYWTWETEYASGDIAVGSTFIDAGDFTMTSDGTYLTVHITTTDPWLMSHLAFWFDDDPSTLQKAPNGNIIPGQMPYQYGPFNPGLNDYTFSVLLSDRVNIPANLDGCVPLYACLHCDVYQLDQDGNPTNANTGTGQNHHSDTFPGKNWFSYYSFNICHRHYHGGGGEPGPCETAFAFDNATGDPGIAKDEYGWFPHFFGGYWGPPRGTNWHPNVARWGWLFGYPNPLIDPNNAWGK